MTYDMIIIGSGIAGISAAIYAKRSNLNVLVLDKGPVGGLLNNIDKITNYPGFTEITGPELAQKLNEHLNSMDINIKNEEVINIKIEGDLKRVETSHNDYLTKTILIATGRTPRKMGLDNEEGLYGRGLSSCALCDGFFFKGKDVAVIGGGNSALQEALYLSKIVNKIYLIHRRSEFRADAVLVDKIKNTNNIEIVYNSNVTNINTEGEMIKSIDLDSGKTFYVSGVFVYIGYTPGTNFVSRLGITNEQGYIVIDNKSETSIKGIYAAGDIVQKQVYQLVTAASEGVLAAINASIACK